MVAELTAHLQALMEFETTRASILRRRLGRPINILIVTDNQPIAVQSTAALAGSRVGGNVNPFWCAIRHIVQSTGVSLTFRFANRPFDNVERIG